MPKSIKTIIVISTITMQVVAGKPIMLFLLDLVNNPMIDGMFVFHFFIRIFVVFCERANNFECTNIFSINFAEKTTFS